MSNSLRIGTRLGPYEITAKLGEGGMGEVWRAKDLQLGRDVALKVLPEGFTADPERAARFDREAKVLASLNRPNIAQIYGLETSGDTRALVMELVEGPTLAERLASGPLPLTESLSVSLQIAQALEEAHGKGIVHRDLKPQNVKASIEGKVKVLDFGLAKASSPLAPGSMGAVADAETEVGGTRAGTILGTGGYMAPEQVRGEPVDGRADIFSFGCVLLEMLSGRRAFARPTAVETMTAILNDEPEELAGGELARALSPAIDRLLAHCLEKRPSGRFQSARDLVFALETVSTMSRTAQIPSSLGLSASSAGIASIAVLPFSNLSGDSDSDYFGQGVAEEILIALARIPALRVAPRSSAFSFEGKRVDLATIARALRVETVLEGSVRRAGRRVRVAARLVSAADGFPLWSETFDRELDDLFAIQEEIARAIAHRLQVAVGGSAGSERLVRPGTGKLEAYDLYLRGRAHFERRGRGLVDALRCFEQALEVDPDNPRVLAGIADSNSLLSFYGSVDPRQAMPQAIRAADRALALDPLLAEAWIARGLAAAYHELDWPGVRTRFERALELAPGSVPGLVWLSSYLSWVEGDLPGGMALAERARRVDPLGIQARLFFLYQLLTAGDLEAAAAELDELERDLPQLWLVYRSKALHRRLLGRPQEAVAAAALAVALSDANPLALGELGLHLAAAGFANDARRIRDELVARSEREWSYGLIVALLDWELGEPAAAIDRLARAIADRDPCLLLMGGWPACRGLASAPEARALLAEVGIRGVWH